MALITCPECKKRISETANSCQNCGFQLSPEIVAKAKKDEKAALAFAFRREHKAKKDEKIANLVILIVIAGIIVFVYKCAQDGSSPHRDTVNTSPSSIDKKIEAWVMAESFVKKYLKSPGTASFGGLFSNYQDPRTHVTYLGNHIYQVQGWVDSQNSFGATVRINFLLKLKDNGNDNWNLLETPVLVEQ